MELITLLLLCNRELAQTERRTHRSELHIFSLISIQEGPPGDLGAVAQYERKCLFPMGE